MTPPPHDFQSAAELAHLRRLKRLRRQVLLILHAARTGPDDGHLKGRFLADVMIDEIPDDDQVFGLLTDLAGAAPALIDCRDDRKRVSDGFGLDWKSYRIAPAGVELLNEVRPPHPLVDDPRIR